MLQLLFWEGEEPGSSALLLLATETLIRGGSLATGAARMLLPLGPVTEGEGEGLL